METITGFADHIIYRNEDNGYTVIALETEDDDIALVGTLPHIEEGMHLEAQGEYSNHAKYGRQFKAVICRQVMPTDTASIERYLASGAIKGIGPTLAARIVAAFGADTLKIIEDEPERLIEIKGISERIAREIAAQTEGQNEMRDAVIKLGDLGLSANMAVKIYSHYGDSLHRVLRENPYRLAEDVDGIGFKIADSIALKLGFMADSEFRVRSGILYVLREKLAEGSTCMPLEECLEKTSELLGIPVQEAEIQLSNLSVDRKVMIRGDLVYENAVYYTELHIASMLMNLNIAMEEEAGEEGDIFARLLFEGAELAEDSLQKKAILESVKNGVFILSGGPGTGKTTTVKLLIKYYLSRKMDVLLAAPTGRAAKRMQEATGYEAKTIHRLLEVAPREENGRGFTYGKGEDEPLDADVIIIDEMSMVDIFLFEALLKAIAAGTRLILVGDIDQLPSVGPGQVLRDLVGSGAFPMVVLKNIFRQGKTSDIVINAHRINNGEMPDLSNKSMEFFFLDRNDPGRICRNTVELIRDKLPGFVGSEARDIQVLVPMRKGNLGTESLNDYLRKYLNPEAPEKKELMHGDQIFRCGDKVMQTKNDYQLEWEIKAGKGIVVESGSGIYNGDVGIIRAVYPELGQLEVEFDDGREVRYNRENLSELEPAFCITIHKSQGSEYPAVIMPLLGCPRLMEYRNLLYTAVTRARKCVVILGSADTLARMIQRSGEGDRLSGLRERISEINIGGAD